MPSVVQMLNIMGLDHSQLLIDLKAREKSSNVKIKDYDKFKAIIKKNVCTLGSDSLNMFPTTNDPYLEDFECDYQLTPNELSFM